MSKINNLFKEQPCPHDRAGLCSPPTAVTVLIKTKQSQKLDMKKELYEYNLVSNRQIFDQLLSQQLANAF